MAAITKKSSVNAKGILTIDNNYIGIENADSGEVINLSALFADFADKTVTISINYTEEYGEE